MIHNGHKLVGFLLVHCSEDEVEEEGSGKRDDISVYGITPFTTTLLERGVHFTGI